MAPFDREAALKAAEKALKLGRIEAAITEYQRIVEAQPRDWNSANALGDLFVRSKQVDKGIAQYTRIADQLAAEGFLPKAAALYKKILKFKPDEEAALLKSADVAARQGLLADAKAAFRTVVERRRQQGDAKGAAEISIRIGTLDPDDLDARLGAARAAIEIGDLATALGQFRDVAKAYETQGNAAAALAAYEAAFELDDSDDDVRRRLLDGYLEAGDLAKAHGAARGAAELKRVVSALERAGESDRVLEVLAEIATLDPTDLHVRADLATAYFARRDFEAAREYLTPETCGRKAALWLTLGEIELASGREAEGRAAVGQALTVDASAREAAMSLGSRLTGSDAEAGYACLDAVAESALHAGDYSGAAAALQEFVGRVPHHVVALMRLVEICVDGGLETTTQQAQGQLADAYLEVGRALEARIISEDLVAREPWNAENVERFRRALLMLGEEDADRIIAERLSGDSPFLSTDDLDLNEGVFFDDAPKPAPPPAPSPVTPQPALVRSKPETVFEDDEELIDLDVSLGDDLGTAEPPPQAAAPVEHEPAPQVAPSPVASSPTGSGSDDEVAAEQYGLALTYRELGMLDDAIQALETAATAPRQRFEAAALLAEIHLERDQVDTALSWYERASESPAPNATAGRNLLYDFAETLEKAGFYARALAVFVELEAEAGGFRDVAYRILRLSKLQAKG
jgi:tetratricopeptide (TPR) repeat protein